MATNTYSKSSPHTRVFQLTGMHGGVPEGPITYTRSWIDSASGVKLPNWKSIVRDGGDATTDFDASETTVDHSDAYFERTYKRKSDGLILTGFYSGNVIRGTNDSPSGNPGTIDVSGASRDASSKFYQRATAAQTQLHTGIVLGELAETLKMIRGRGASMDRLLRGWRTTYNRCRNMSRKEALKRLADAYLELQFGWKPLASDISGALAAYKNPRKELTRVSCSAEASGQLSDTRVLTGLDPTRYIYTQTDVARARVSIRGGVKVEVSGHGRNLQAFGLLPHNFIVDVYELVPWSFLVDYFTDLGGVLTAIAFPKSDIAWCSTTKVQTLERRFVTPTFYPQANVHLYDELTATFIPQVTIWRKKRVTRRRGIPPIPRPTARVPSSLWKWANIAALAITRDYSRLRI